LNSPVSIGNETYLVFCRDNVDPDVVTRILELSPSKSLHVGDTGHYEWNGRSYVSQVGLWKLRLPGADHTQRVEDQIGGWIELLRPKSTALGLLRELGYNPYIECRAESGHCLSALTQKSSPRLAHSMLPSAFGSMNK
jgi:hypothetical protein